MDPKQTAAKKMLEERLRYEAAIPQMGVDRGGNKPIPRDVLTEKNPEAQA